MDRPDLELSMESCALGPRGRRLAALYKTMLTALGPSLWWPADTPFEVAVGAILTQNTAWANVTQAIAGLRALDALHPSGMRGLSLSRLEEAVRPSGYFRQKAKKLVYFLDFLANRGGIGTGRNHETALACLQDLPMDALRQDLLAVRGIGPETADCILLYALGYPSFVADAYTLRILHRHGLASADADYDELRDFFMSSLPCNAALFNEYHALLVRVGNNFCRKSAPLCSACPLEPFLEHSPV